ncbi:caspase recruitment domain-containing protein 9-like [Sinocyclocheilus rhinocerous]|uniref:caspase recruitment domain-containing protein 9-like n=1 Tax=Sinocyclocheilus rhinocerous TaxID=307959 RepID=UPI0007B7CF80|nr:PREDICTED: caspase recruitment domain-containing protein 9-like [Sinocyclocheilus rhinocerous]
MFDGPGGFEVEEDDECWARLEDYRMLLIKTIEPSRITPYLRQCKVLSSEDEEQIYNDPSLVIRRRKVGVLLDILQRTGLKGYEAFLESLELDYPDVYRKITGKEPARVFSVLIDTAGECGLTQFLMSEVSRLQKLAQDERRMRLEVSAQAAEQLDTIRQLQLCESELHKQQDRVQRIREERERMCEEARILRDENYRLMHDLTRLSEDKNCALMCNRDLQLEYREEKDELELKCIMLKKDSKMYRDRMEDILKQLEEVIKERDKAICTREEYHLENSKNLQDKDQYRKQIREMGERYDELQVQLFRTQGEVLALQSKLRKQKNPIQMNSEESSLLSSFEMKSQTSEEESRERGEKDMSEGSQSQTSGEYNYSERMFSEEDISANCRIKAKCNFHYRSNTPNVVLDRKRALRTKKFTDKESVQCILDNTTGSDTDGM